MVGLLKFLIPLFALIIALALTIRIYNQDESSKRDTPFGIRPFGLILGIILFIVAIVTAMSMGQISSGNKGVVLKFGALTNKTLNEGLYFITPFVNSVEVMTVQTQVLADVKATAASGDLQDVSTTITLNYELDELRVNEIYRNLRRDYVTKVISPAIQDTVRAVTAKVQRSELITERQKVR